MNILLGVIVGILVLTILVVLHEGGHFMMARKNGVKVNEFGIGFPPRVIAWIHAPVKSVEKYCKELHLKEGYAKKLKAKAAKKSSDKYVWIRYPKADWYEETKEGLVPKQLDHLVFSIDLLPIGGFCSMDGESDADTRKGTFGAASFWAKTKILFGGVMMNWLTAIIIFTILAFCGMPKFLDNQFYIADDITIHSDPVTIASVIENSPAERAGIHAGDQIVEAKYGDRRASFVRSEGNEAFPSYNEMHAGEEISYLVYTKEPVENEVEPSEDCALPEGYKATYINVTLNKADAEYLFGVTMYHSSTTYKATWSAPVVGVVTTAQVTGETFRGLGNMIVSLFKGIVNQFNPDEQVREEAKADLEVAGNSVAGPVGILGTLFPAYVSAGPLELLFLAAIISVSLACMNVLPIPALDGGRWLLIAIFRLRKKPLTTEIEGKIVSRAFIALMLLAVLITVLDITKLFK